MAKISRDKARGCMLGLAIGDALGAPMEFSQQPELPFGVHLPGPRNELPTMLRNTTDDTAMAAILARSLAKRGRLDVPDVVAGYCRWSETAPDVGLQTDKVLRLVDQGLVPDRASEKVWRKSGACGNGAMMRVAPLAMFLADKGENHVVRCSIEECRSTHFSPLCQVSNASYAYALWSVLSSRRKLRGRELSKVARTGIELGAEFVECAREDSAKAAEQVFADLDAAGLANPGVYSEGLHLFKTMGYVRVAYRLAFWELFHAPSFEAALTDVVNRGGDADTNGAITGALLGAYYGESKIPERWVHAITADGNPDVKALLDLADAVSE